MKEIKMKRFKNIVEGEALSGIRFRPYGFDMVNYAFDLNTTFNTYREDGVDIFNMDLKFKPTDANEADIVERLIDVLAKAEVGIHQGKEVASVGMMLQNPEMTTTYDEINTFTLSLGNYTMSEHSTTIAGVKIITVQVDFGILEEGDSVLELWFAPKGNLHTLSNFIGKTLTRADNKKLMPLIMSGAFGGIPSMVRYNTTKVNFQLTPSNLNGWSIMNNQGYLVIIGKDASTGIDLTKHTLDVHMGNPGYVITLFSKDSLIEIYL